MGSFKNDEVRADHLAKDLSYTPWRRTSDQFRRTGADPNASNNSYEDSASGSPYSSANADVEDDGVDDEEEGEAEVVDEDNDDGDGDDESDQPERLYDGEGETINFLSTHDEGLDHVLCGGIPAGKVVIVGAAPGTGKSTILRSSAAAMAHHGLRVLIAHPEESKNQARQARNRLKLAKKYPKAKTRLFHTTTSNLEKLLDYIDKLKVDVAIIDSLQYMESDEFKVSAAIEICKMLCKRAHATDNFEGKKPVAMFIVSHATKEGKLAGQNAILHAVDASIWLDHIDIDTLLPTEDQEQGTGFIRLQIYKAKIRWGTNLRKAYYEMTEYGLKYINPDVRAAFERVREGTRRRPSTEDRRRQARPRSKPTGRAVGARGARQR